MTARSAAWSDTVKVHPAAAMFPMMARAELRALGDDIKLNGLKHRPVYFLTRETRKLLLDGRNRLAAMELAGLSTDGEGNIVKEGEVDPYAYVISANIHRRHLTGEQKRELIAKLLVASPERSDRAIATLAKVDHKTVAAVRAESEATGEIPQLAKTVGSDGKARSKPRKLSGATPKAATGRDGAAKGETIRPSEIKSSIRTAREKERSALTGAVKPAPKTPHIPAAQARAVAISSFATTLHLRLADTLDDLTRLLGDEKVRIADAVPLHKRVVLARGYLAALGVGLDDLRPIGAAGAAA